MKKFKLYDTWISILLIIGFTIFSLVKLDETFFIGYFVVGGWQIISMLVHVHDRRFVEKGSSRKFYHTIIFYLLIFLVIGIIFSPILYILLLFLLFAAPFMAVYYTWICYHEVYVKMQRPLAILK